MSYNNQLEVLIPNDVLLRQYVCLFIPLLASLPLFHARAGVCVANGVPGRREKQQAVPLQRVSQCGRVEDAAQGGHIYAWL